MIASQINEMLQYFSYHRTSHICVTRRSNIFWILVESSKFCFSLWACCGWTCCSSRSSQTPPSRCPRPRPCPPRPCVPSWIWINYFNTKGHHSSRIKGQIDWQILTYLKYKGTYWLTWHQRRKQWEGLHLLLSQQAWSEWTMQISM